MNPFSAGYYVKENKGRALLIIFMLFLSVFMFFGGNYVDSMGWFWQKAFAYSDQLVLVSLNSTDEEYKDYQSVLLDLAKDDRLSFVERTAWGFGGLPWTTTMGFEMGSRSYVFRSAEDLKKVFHHLGISCETANLKHRSMVISEAFARNRGIHLGDRLDGSFDPAISGTFTVDAFIDDDSFVTFYVIEDDENLGEVYIYSDSMRGEELYTYVRELCGERKVTITSPVRDLVGNQLEIFYIIFFAGVVLLSLVLSVTIHSVITGQYLKRTYEFGVYRALGRSKWEIRKKCMKEILLMDGIAVFAGAVVIYLLTYLLNVKYYIPKGQYLPYASKTALAGFLICNILVIVPMVIGKGNQMAKADVTEF